MTGTPISMTDLAIAIREGAELEANHNFGKSVLFTLPSSGDEISLWPAPSKPSSPLTLFWLRRSPEGQKIGRGQLDWTSDPRPIVDWVIGIAYSADEIGPQYAPVLTTLHKHNVNAALTQVQGIGFLLHVALPDSTYLVIGGDEGLPSRPDQVENWHVQHEGVNAHIAVVFHGPELPAMVAATQRYLQATATRYGSHHPLGAPVPDEHAAGPDKLCRLLAELSDLRRFDRAAPGGAVITVFDPDGYNGASVDVPAELVARICRLLSVEKQVIQTYGG
ncbi:hypothetical protein ABZU94_39300 [Streptomyces mirabilis]|uniref:hypothetical protein n=1 Tax=Streptomyces sp. NPDC005388 TaxID=3156717 RepID=UPI0033A05489